MIAPTSLSQAALLVGEVAANDRFDPSVFAKEQEVYRSLEAALNVCSIESTPEQLKLIVNRQKSQRVVLETIGERTADQSAPWPR